MLYSLLILVLGFSFHETQSTVREFYRQTLHEPLVGDGKSERARGVLTSIAVNSVKNSVMEKSSFQQNCMAENVLSKEKY